MKTRQQIKDEAVERLKKEIVAIKSAILISDDKTAETFIENCAKSFLLAELDIAIDATIEAGRVEKLEESWNKIETGGYYASDKIAIAAKNNIFNQAISQQEENYKVFNAEK